MTRMPFAERVYACPFECGGDVRRVYHGQRLKVSKNAKPYVCSGCSSRFTRSELF